MVVTKYSSCLLQINVHCRGDFNRVSVEGYWNYFRVDSNARDEGVDNSLRFVSLILQIKFLVNILDAIKHRKGNKLMLFVSVIHPKA